VQLEFEGRYAAMLSHEPKNYALLTYSGALLLRGVAFRSSRAEPFGESFLRTAIRKLLDGDVAGVRRAYVDTLDALRTRQTPTRDVASNVRLTKTPEQYLAIRDQRKELPYEAMLAAGRNRWSAGDRVLVYRTRNGRGGVIDEDSPADPRDYNTAEYARLLHDTYAARLARAFTPEDYEALFADPDQLSLFAPAPETIRTILTSS
jgi:hypothetical protein